MTRKASLVAGVFSLIHVGAWGMATAETNTADSDSNPGVITLFGKTLCTADAPPMIQCDWRMPELTTTAAEPATQTPQTPMPKKSEKPTVYSLFGLTFCFGEQAPRETACTFQVPPALQPEQRQASL